MLQTAQSCIGTAPRIETAPEESWTQDEPGSFRLGPFVVGADGLLRSASAAAAPGFSVQWRGRTARARIEAADRGALRLEAVLGRVPSTALCGGDPGPRARAFGLLRALPRHLPTGWEFRLLADHYFGVAAWQSLTLPASAADLLAALTGFLVCLDPYLDVLDATGAGFAAAAPGRTGTAKICPG